MQISTPLRSWALSYAAPLAILAKACKAVLEEAKKDQGAHPGYSISLFPSGGQGLGDKLQDELQTSFMLPNSCIPQVFFKEESSAHSDCGPFGVIYLCSFSVLHHPLWSNSSGFGKDELIPSAGKDIFPGKPHFGSASLPLTSLGEPGELTGRSWG